MVAAGRRGWGVLELLLAVALLGVLLANLPWPRPDRRQPATPVPLPRWAEALLWDLEDAQRVDWPRPNPGFPVTPYARRLSLASPAGPVEYSFETGWLLRRLGGRVVARTRLDQAWFQVRDKGPAGWVVRVRLVRGNEALLTAGVVGAPQ